MSKNRSRFEVVQPEWVKDPSKWPFGKVILPTKRIAVKRLLLDADTLRTQLGCPRPIVAAFLKAGQVHEATRGEKAAGLGLCAEDLAALGLAGQLCVRYRLRLASMIVQVLGDLRSELLESPRPKRVILGVLRANKRIEARVGTTAGGGELSVWDYPQDQAVVSDFYDASDLRDRIDEAMHRIPLDLPRPESCMITRPRKGTPRGTQR